MFYGFTPAFTKLGSAPPAEILPIGPSKVALLTFSESKRSADPLNYAVKLLSIGTNDLTTEKEVKLELDAKITSLWYLPLAKESNGLAFTCNDESFRVLINNNYAFKREEALASLDAIEFLDIPEDQLSTLNTYFEALKYHDDIWHVPTNFFKRIQYQIDEFMTGTLRIQSNHSLRKMMIVTTKAGRVFGIDVDSRRVIWSVNHGKFERSFILGEENPVLVMDRGNSVDLVWVDVVTGAQTRKETAKDFSLR
jgi:hypothetical protein